MSAPYDPARRAAIDTLIGALLGGATSGSDIWAKLDVVQVYAAGNRADALLNWKGDGFAAATGGGDPRFVADRGFWTDGLDDWIDTGFAPAAGVQFQQAGGSVGAFLRKSDRSQMQPVGTHASNAVSLTMRNASGISAVRVNGVSLVAAGPAVASGYGLVAGDRAGTALTGYRNGEPFGSASGATQARSTATIGIGKQGGANYAEGQCCLFFAGAALTAAEHADLYAAFAAYLTAIGVAEIVPATRTLPLMAGIALPDGSAPPTAGRGMGLTGLMRRPDGRWYVANGIAGRTDLWFSRMSADFATIEAEFRASTFGLGADYQGSIQGMALDTSDQTMWAILKLAGAGGATTYLLHFDLGTETMIGQPVPIAASDTGIAYDPAVDALWITRDGGSSAGSLLLYGKDGVPRSGAVATPGGTDQCFHVATPSGALMAGDLLVTAGANGADGTVTVYNRLDYGGMIARRIDTLVAAQQIEGVVLDGGTYYVGNDGSTHPGARNRNEVLTYAA
ncbi:MAG: hypothetical protein PGN09_06605 [Sphingomonas fennica]